MCREEQTEKERGVKENMKGTIKGNKRGSMKEGTEQNKCWKKTKCGEKTRKGRYGENKSNKDSKGSMKGERGGGEATFAAWV